MSAGDVSTGHVWLVGRGADRIVDVMRQLEELGLDLVGVRDEVVRLLAGLYEAGAHDLAVNQEARLIEARARRSRLKAPPG
jgi:hypothetical protein